MTDTLRTIDTITETPIYCACCGSVDGLRFEETITGTVAVTCQTCGFFWEEEG